MRIGFSSPSHVPAFLSHRPFAMSLPNVNGMATKQDSEFYMTLVTFRVRVSLSIMGRVSPT